MKISTFADVDVQTLLNAAVDVHDLVNKQLSKVSAEYIESYIKTTPMLGHHNGTKRFKAEYIVLSTETYAMIEMLLNNFVDKNTAEEIKFLILSK